MSSNAFDLSTYITQLPDETSSLNSLVARVEEDTPLASQQYRKYMQREGENLMEKHVLLRDLSRFMETPESRYFYQLYFHRPKLLQMVMFLLKLYGLIDSHLYQKSGIPFTPAHKIFMIHRLWRSPTLRPLLKRALLQATSRPLLTPLINDDYEKVK